jgi:hypothetical protein
MALQGTSNFGTLAPGSFSFQAVTRNAVKGPPFGAGVGIALIRKFAAAGVCLGLSSGCGGDSAELDVAQREATVAECAHGGLVLSFNGEEQPAVCNGANGVAGEDGEDGAQGPVGVQGDTGATGAPGAVGASGANGTDGSPGAPGNPGLSAAAQVAETISCISGKRSSLVAIQCDDGVVIELGSGTVTLSGQVFTAAHVVANLASASCTVFDADADHATVIGTVLSAEPDPTLDSAVVTVSWAGTTPAGIAAVQRPPALGEMVVATGHPNALSAIQYSSGFVTSVNVIEMGADWAGAFMADYSSNGGGSGGAIFNADCEWVGIHVGGFSDGLETSIALPF